MVPWAPVIPVKVVPEQTGGDNSAPLERYATRWHYYTAIKGDAGKRNELRDQLAQLDFDADVFLKVAGKSKGVDISLARDMLGHAYKDSYDAAVLIAGDGDYVPLVEDVKRLGKQVYVVFFAADGNGLSPELRRAADTFFDFSPDLENRWRSLSHLWSAPPQSGV